MIVLKYIITLLMSEANERQPFKGLLDDLQYLEGSHSTLYTLWKNYLLLKQSEYDKILKQVKVLREKTENSDFRKELTQKNLEFLYLFMLSTS